MTERVDLTNDDGAVCLACGHNDPHDGMGGGNYCRPCDESGGMCTKVHRELAALRASVAELEPLAEVGRLTVEWFDCYEVDFPRNLAGKEHARNAVEAAVEYVRAMRQARDAKEE